MKKIALWHKRNQYWDGQILPLLMEHVSLDYQSSHYTPGTKSDLIGLDMNIFCIYFKTLSLLMKTLAAWVDSVDQDQTAENVQSDLWSKLSTFLF